MAAAVRKWISSTLNRSSAAPADIDRIRAALPYSHAAKAIPKSKKSELREWIPFLTRKKHASLEDLARVYPPTQNLTPLSASPYADLRQMADEIKQYSSDPVQIEAGDLLPSTEWNDPLKIPSGSTYLEAQPKSRERPIHECPNCGWPTHASQASWELDQQRHAQVCPTLRQWTEDEHDLRSGRPMWELNFPGRQPRNHVLNLTDWQFLFVTRRFSKAVLQNPTVQRHVSRLLTYPYTVASLLNKPWVYYNSKTEGEEGQSIVTDNGWHLLSGLSHAIEVATKSAKQPSPTNTITPAIQFTNEPTSPLLTNDPFRIFILGSGLESRLPPSVWEQLSLTFPGAPFRVYFIGPEAQVPATPFMSRAEPVSKYRPPSGGGLVGNWTQPQQRSITFTQPQLDAETGKELDEVRVEKQMISTVLPLSVNMRLEFIQSYYHDVHEAFGPFRRNRDVFMLMNSGISHPLLRDQWQPTIRKLLKTRCLTVFTAINASTQESDRALLEEQFQGQYDMVMRPTKNKFASLKVDVPVDAVHDPEHGWAQCNQWIWAVQGLGTDVGRRNEQGEVVSEENNNKSWF